MANLRNLKKEIDYRLEKEVFEVMQEAVAVRNDLFTKANNPAEPHNRSLVRKHFAALRVEMVEAYDKLFEKLSKINEAKK